MLSDLFYRYRGGTRLLRDLFQDLKYGLRMLAKNPGLTFVIVLSLAIGIGANTAVFSVTSTLLLKPLPIRTRIGWQFSGSVRRESAYRRTGPRRGNTTTSKTRTTFSMIRRSRSARATPLAGSRRP